MPVHTTVAREDSPFGGPPAAAIAVGVEALAVSSSESSLYTIVLVYGMPRIESAVVSLADRNRRPSASERCERKHSTLTC